VVEVTPELLAAGKMENCFRDASDLVEQFLIEGATKVSGAAEIATVHLICRSLTDLGWAQYLASSGFTIQMYSLVRPAIESINLVELFAQEPEAADAWIAGEFWEFRPAKVRERLGLGDDPIYSWACECSHPRFAGLQHTMFVSAEEQEGFKVLRPFTGGLPLEIPPVLMATTWPAHVLRMLTLALEHCPVKKEVAYTWPTVTRKVGETVRPGVRGGLQGPARTRHDRGGGREDARRARRVDHRNRRDGADRRRRTGD
jgi:hypothetical protein